MPGQFALIKLLIKSLAKSVSLCLTFSKTKIELLELRSPSSYHLWKFLRCRFSFLWKTLAQYLSPHQQARFNLAPSPTTTAQPFSLKVTKASFTMEECMVCLT